MNYKLFFKHLSILFLPRCIYGENSSKNRRENRRKIARVNRAYSACKYGKGVVIQKFKQKLCLLHLLKGITRNTKQ